MSVESSQEKTEEIAAIIKSYPAEKRYIIAIMHELNRNYRYLPRAALEMTAEHVGVPFSHVYSMATFYKTFSLVPRGRINLKVCDGTTCHIKGSSVLVEEIYRQLGIRPGETTPDGEFSLETVNCIGACALAPALLVGERVYSLVNSSRLQEIIQEYRGGEGDANNH